MNDHNDLITRYLVGVASPEEVDALEAELAKSQDLQDQYLHEVEIDCYLKQETIRASEFSTSQPQTQEINTVVLKSRNSLTLNWPVTIAATVIGMIVSAALLLEGDNQSRLATPSLGEVQFAQMSSEVDIFKSAATGDLVSLKYLIKKGTLINATNQDGLSPLHLSVLYGHRDVAVLLIEQGASLQQKDKLGNTALHMAAFLGRWVIVEELLDAGSDPRIRNKDGFNTDDLVALNWNPNLERYYGYLEQIFGFELNYEEIRQVRPLIRATISRYMNESDRSYESDPASFFVTTTAQLLGKTLAPSNSNDTIPGFSPPSLAQAAMTGNFLSSSLARVIPTRKTGTPPTVSLSQAARTGNIAAVEQHIEAGSDLNVENEFDGCTPVILAAACGHTDVVRKLVEAGADLTKTNNQQHTALHAASFFCRIEIVEFLINSKIDLTQVNNKGETALNIVEQPMTAELRSVYQYVYGMMKLECDLKKIEKDRSQVASILAEKLP